MRYVNVFATTADFNNASTALPRPQLAYVEDTKKVYSLSVINS